MCGTVAWLYAMMSDSTSPSINPILFRLFAQPNSSLKSLRNRLEISILSPTTTGETLLFLLFSLRGSALNDLYIQFMQTFSFEKEAL